MPSRATLTLLPLAAVALVLLIVLFCAARGGLLVASWWPPLIALLGQLLDVWGALVLAFDALNMGRKVIDARPIAFFWDVGPNTQDELDAELASRAEEADRESRPTIRGLVFIFLGFVLQAGSSLVSFANAIR